MKQILLGIAIAVAVALSFCAGRYIFPERNEVVKVQRDTLWRTDSFFFSHPEPASVKLLPPKIVKVTERDTLRVHDTLYLSLPIEQKVYEDSTYRAVVSGFQPSLDEITVYQRTQTIYEAVERVSRQRWGFGLSTGIGGFYGLTTHRFDAGVGLMFSVNYNF